MGQWQIKTSHYLSSLRVFQSAPPLKYSLGCTSLYYKQALAVVVLEFIYLFLDRGEGRERNINVWLVSCTPSPLGTWSTNPDMCPDWESNQRPFGVQAGTQATEPGLVLFLMLYGLLKWNNHSRVLQLSLPYLGFHFLITFVRPDFSPLSHLRAGGARQFFGGSMSDFSWERRISLGCQGVKILTVTQITLNGAK